MTLLLPVAAGRAAEPGLTPAGPALGGSHARILPVDDDELVLGVASDELRDAGFEVASAADCGPAALARLDCCEQVDMVISDLCMPGMDGMAVIGEAQRRRPGVPAILLTGFASQAVQVAAVDGGSFSLLRKPVTLGQLADRIGSLLDGRAGTGPAAAGSAASTANGIPQPCAGTQP